jgi:hypothetical protein
VIERVSDRVVRDGDLAIKKFARGDADKARIEAALLVQLAGGAGYRVPRLVELRVVGDEHHLLTRWEGGHEKVYTEISDDEWAQLGATLAALHHRLDECAPPAELPSLRAVIAARDLDSDRAQLAQHRAEAGGEVSGYFDDRALLLEERATRVRGVPDSDKHAIHNDYNQFNYRFFDSGPPLIVDWEGAIAAPREYEVVRCLNHLPIVQPRSARRFVDAYLALRPLGREALAWAVDAALADHALKHWTVARWLRDRNERFTGVVTMTRVLVGRRAELDRFFAELV